MTEKIILAGAGGQGIMLLGKVLARAAVKENRYVSWLPAYGAEVRGGFAYCMVIISSEEIGSPYIIQADTLIAMNEPALIRFKARLKPKGLLVLNRSLIKKKIFNKKIKVLAFPFTEIAFGLGNIKTANIVALGSFLAQKSIVDKKTIFSVISEMAPSLELKEVNLKAFKEGLRLK